MVSPTFTMRMRAWLLAALALLAAAGCAGCADAGREAPMAVGGTLDLRGWDFGRRGMVALDGQWEILWRRFEDPAPAPGQMQSPTGLIAVPGEWNDLPVPGDAARGEAAGVAGGHGFATYRLTVLCGGTGGLALNLPVQHSAVHLYVNGRLVARQGTPGATPGQARPQTLQQIADLDAAACPLRIVAHVSNYDIRRGGLMRSIEIGGRSQVHERRELALARDLFTLGALSVMGLLTILFFLSRRKDRSPLYFGLFCLAFSLSIGMSGSRILQPLLAPLGWDGYLQLVFAGWYMGLTLFMLFLRSLYPEHFSRVVARAIVAWGVGSVAFVAVTPAWVFSHTVPLLQAGAAAVALYMLATLVRVVLGGRRSAAMVLAGAALLFAAILHDTLQYQHLQRLSLLPFGLFAFVVAPALLLARRFSRALAAEELRAIEQRERADLLVRSTGAGLLDWDSTTGRITYSGRYREMLGYPPDDGARLPPFNELIHPDERADVHGQFLAQLRDRSVRDAVRPYRALEYRMRRADGDYIWVHAEGIGLCGADGRTLRFICSFIDISERKRQEIEMSNRVKFISDLFDSVPLGLALRDEEGRYLVVNRTWERYIGLSRGSVIGTSLQDLSDPAASTTLALDRQALALGPGAVTGPLDYEYQGRRYMQTRSVMMDAQGQRIGVLVTSLDITEKHATEQALAVERERLRLLVRSTKAGFGDWDALRNSVTYSGRFKEMLGYPPDADSEAWPSIFEMMHPDDRERARGEFRAMLRRKATPGEQEPGKPMSYRLRRVDGSYIWIHAEGIAQVDETGRTRRFITSYLDVTAFHEQEEALRASRDQVAAQAALLERQNEALKENVRLREEVERIGRHDLKTPLNSIVAVPRLLREERQLGKEADELLGIVERAGYRILSMVNLSLDLYKMEQGGYVFRPDAVDLADLVDKVIADVRMHAASKQVVLGLGAMDAPYAWAEELLCYSLVANLMKNAVEASPVGKAVTVSAQAGADGTVLLRIHNVGAVPPAVRASFFQKYMTAGKASGTGLGTYSARLMARVQDGDIAMETSDEAGTTLTVRLRAAPAGAVPATARHAAERSGLEPQRIAAMAPRRVLLVDDDEYNLLIVRRFLPSPPFTVDTAINGRVALAAAELQWPDVVFMDLDMPVMGGMEAVGRLRELERATLARRCTMVALSSHEDEETRRRALAAGFDRYLTKPVTRELIHETLLEMDMLIGQDEAPADPSSVLPMPPAAPARAAEPGMRDALVLDPDVEPVLAEFLASRRALVAAMAQAMDAGQRGEVRRIAHQLAGSFGLYGFGWAAAQCRFVEANFSDVDAGRVAALAAQLREHLDTVQIHFGQAQVQVQMQVPPLLGPA